MSKEEFGEFGNKRISRKYQNRAFFYILITCVLFFINRSGKGGTVASLLISDKTETVEVVFFNEKIKQMNLAKNGDVVIISNLKPQIQYNDQYKRGTVNFNLIAQVGSEVTLCTEDSEIPHISLTKYLDVECYIGKRVNLLGIVIQQSEITTVGNFNKKEILISDGIHKINITLWNNNANIDLTNGQIILIEQTIAKVYGGDICCSGGTVEKNRFFNEDMLKHWWVNGDKNNLLTLEHQVKKLLQVIDTDEKLFVNCTIY